MSRLIDADMVVSLLEVIRRPYNAPILNGIIKAINDQPTAYDVDKIVEELEMETCVNLEDVYKEAIDIVKRGGVE